MLIGVDAGGTSTRAAILDATGQCVGYGIAGAGNPISWGENAAAQAIRQAVRHAADQARAEGFTGAGDGVAVLAMAGASSLLAPGLMDAAVAESGHTGRVEIASDLLATFSSGTARRSGYVLVSGTGSAALRVEDGVTTAAADGLGWLLGDRGSGFWIGHRVVRCAVAALNGYGPATELATLLGRELDLPSGGGRTAAGRPVSLDVAVEKLYRLKPVELSRFAALAFQAARVTALTSMDPFEDFGPPADGLAAAILTEARTCLIGTLRAVHVEALPGPVIVGGSIAARLPGLGAAITSLFRGLGLGTVDVTLVPDGIVGACLLALRSAGIEVDDDVFRRLTGSIAARR